MQLSNDTTSNRKLILYIATSADGYIAKPGDDLRFLDIALKEGEDYGYGDFIAGVDTVILGRKTYDYVLQHVEIPHPDKKVFIITRTHRPERGNATFYSGNISHLINGLKSEPGKNIFCDGGAELVQVLLNENLLDEMIISIVPVMVGNGIKLFLDGRPEQRVELLSVKTFETGVVQLHYRCLYK